MKQRNRISTLGRKAVLSTLLLAVALFFAGCDFGPGQSPTVPTAPNVWVYQSFSDGLKIMIEMGDYHSNVFDRRRVRYSIFRSGSATGPWYSISTIIKSINYRHPTFTTYIILPPNHTFFFKVTREIDGLFSVHSPVFSGTTLNSGVSYINPR